MQKAQRLKTKYLIFEIGFITTPKLNRLTKTSLDTRTQEAAKCLVSKSQVDNALDIAGKNREKIKKLQTFDFSYFIGRRYFGDDGSQHCLVLQAFFKSFLTATENVRILARKSKGLSEKISKPPATANNSLVPK